MWKPCRNVWLTERNVNYLQSICYNDASLRQDAMDHFVLLVTATRHCTVPLCGNGKGCLHNPATGLTHILTHTGRSVDGPGSIGWIFGLQDLLQIGRNRANNTEEALRSSASSPLTVAHNPEVVGSSPSPATKSVTVVDTISTTVIFYFLLLCRQFLRKNRGFQNISAVEQTVMSHLPQPGVPKSTACKNCNRYKNTNDKLLFFICMKPPEAATLL